MFYPTLVCSVFAEFVIELYISLTEEKAKNARFFSATYMQIAVFSTLILFLLLVVFIKGMIDYKKPRSRKSWHDPLKMKKTRATRNYLLHLAELMKKAYLYMKTLSTKYIKAYIPNVHINMSIFNKKHSNIQNTASINTPSFNYPNSTPHNPSINIPNMNFRNTCKATNNNENFFGLQNFSRQEDVPLIVNSVNSLHTLKLRDLNSMDSYMHLFQKKNPAPINLPVVEEETCSNERYYSVTNSCTQTDEAEFVNALSHCVLRRTRSGQVYGWFL